ncbi:MAG TPA: condensation domain-containing protein [Actinophytocola sp.]|uniref:condensation domain-containing protein n=1 Tax=Actinophytocola sp. TaxID=1872138 RepID=UPI002F93F913
MSAARQAELCWGQRYHWLRYQAVPEDARHDAHIVVRSPLPGGVTVAHLRTALNLLVRRHEALRTVYHVDADPWPRQQVRPPAPVPLHEVSTEADGTPSPAEVLHELTVTNFALADEAPARACVVTTGGVPRQLVLVLNHISFDDWSIDELRKELQAILAAIAQRKPAALPPVIHQPVDVARDESARPRAAVDAALDHWRAEIAGVPADMFVHRRVAGAQTGSQTGAVTGTEVTAYSAALTAPSLLAVVRDIAGQHNTWTSAVHLAAYTATMAAYTCSAVVAPQWLTSHRRAGAQMSVLTCMFSPALVPVQVADDPSFAEVLRRVVAGAERARAHANVPYDEVLELTSLESFRRGQPVRTASELNFLNYAPRSCGTRRDRFTWNGEPTDWAKAGTDTYTRVYEWQDGITIGLAAMATVMDADAVERFLRGYVDLLRLHRDPSVDLRISEVAARIGFAPPAQLRTARIGTDLVDLDATEAALREHPGVASATVRATVRAGEQGLVAEVAPAGTVTPAELRGHLLDVMEDRAGVRCPGWFEIDGAAAGDGLPAQPRTPATAAEEALAAAVAEVNGLEVVDLAGSYTAAGGRMLRLPRVLGALREGGWAGLTVRRLAGARPLAGLAAQLHRSQATHHLRDQPAAAGAGRG